MLKNAVTSTLAVAALALLTAAPASAAPVSYAGKTSAGSEVVLKRSGMKVTDLRAYVPAACASSRTSDTKSGAEAFILPQPVAIGGEQTLSTKQPSSLGLGSEGVTMNYRVTLTKGKGARGAITGKLHMNFMLVEPYYNAMGYLDGNTFICQADATFTARPVLKRTVTRRRGA